MKVLDIELLYKGKRNNFFRIKYLNKVGKEKFYEIISRKNKDELQKEIIEKQYTASGVVMFILNKNQDKVLIQKEFRVPANDFMFTFPAGLLDKKEKLTNAIKRETKEETGLTIELENIKRISLPRFAAVGLTDDKISVAYIVSDSEGVDSELNTDGNSDQEDIKPRWINKQEALKIIEEDKCVGSNTELLLQGWCMK